MKELAAVNMLLRVIGSSPVNSLVSEHPDVANAKDTLTRVSNKMQKRGWWFNTDYGVDYQADLAGTVIVPEEIVLLVAEDQNFIKRSNKIYDRVNQTFNIGMTVHAIKVVRRFTWEDLPESLQDYVAYLAAAEFISLELEDRGKQETYLQFAGLAKVDLDAEDLDSDKVNIYHNSRVIRARGGVRPYRSKLRNQW